MANAPDLKRATRLLKTLEAVVVVVFFSLVTAACLVLYCGWGVPC